MVTQAAGIGSAEFCAIVAALRELPGSFVIDGEAVAHCPEDLPDFHRLLWGRWSALRAWVTVSAPRPAGPKPSPDAAPLRSASDPEPVGISA